MLELLAALPGPLPLKLALLALPMLPNWWGIWHAARHRFNGQGQIVWIMICVFLPVIGGLAYIFIGRGKALKASVPENNANQIAE